MVNMPERSAEWFRRVDSLFDAALERPETERAAFLVATCPDDAELRKEVEVLLATADTAESYLGENVAEFAAPLLDSLPDGEPFQEAVLEPGTRVGNWIIEREVGRGGMGAVYLATRREGDFTMRAAL